MSPYFAFWMTGMIATATGCPCAFVDSMRLWEGHIALRPPLTTGVSLLVTGTSVTRYPLFEKSRNVMGPVPLKGGQ